MPGINGSGEAQPAWTRTPAFQWSVLPRITPSSPRTRRPSVDLVPPLRDLQREAIYRPIAAHFQVKTKHLAELTPRFRQLALLHQNHTHIIMGDRHVGFESKGLLELAAVLS